MRWYAYADKGGSGKATKVGEKVWALWREGDAWYPAVIR
jgi:hypothetical protein